MPVLYVTLIIVPHVYAFTNTYSSHIYSYQYYVISSIPLYYTTAIAAVEGCIGRSRDDGAARLLFSGRLEFRRNLEHA